MKERAKYTRNGKLVLPFDHFRGMCPQKRTKKTWNKSSQYRNCKTDHLESENILATPRILTKIFGVDISCEPSDTLILQGGSSSKKHACLTSSNACKQNNKTGIPEKLVICDLDQQGSVIPNDFHLGF